MPRYTFVLRETREKGKPDHGNHLHRRNDRAIPKAAILLTFLAKPVDEDKKGDDWYYTWTVDTPDISVLTGVLIPEFVSHGFVALDSGPTLVPTDRDLDLAYFKKLSDILKKAFPKK